jgi:hypothetical protein
MRDIGPEDKGEDMKTVPFDSFPLRMVIVSNAVGLAIYAIGLYLMAQLGILWALLYVVYCIWMECRVLSKSCRYCYYFGRRCGFGKGRVCSWFLSKGTGKTLSEKQISWWDIVPDFLVSLIPLGVGIVMLIQSFSWPALIPVAVLVFLGSVGTGLVRGRIACKYCKQRELGCPAEQLFGKRKHHEQI